MSTTTRDLLESPAGFRSREAGRFFAQMEDQSRRLKTDTRGLTPDELEWQPAPGMNTIGMLLAHIAIVEVYWTTLGPLGSKEFRFHELLGIGEDDDGLPVPEGGTPPATLRRKDLAFFDDLLARARAFVRDAMSKLEDEDLSRTENRIRRDGSGDEFTVRWVLYHMLEHLAGHYGQVNLLRHQYREQHAGKRS